MYAQFDEDEIIDAYVADDGIAVEIGAGNGQHLSNTAMFRERGWKTILVEPAEEHRDALLTLAANNPNVEVHLLHASPENINHLVPDDATILSIDVDGDDYFILEALEKRPRIIIVEFNPTMPRNVDIRPARRGLQIGSSVAALRRIAKEKGYGLAHVTHCNVIFILDAEDEMRLQERPVYTVATEYFTGRPVVIGTAPWGVDFANPYPAEDVIVRTET